MLGTIKGTYTDGTFFSWKGASGRGESALNGHSQSARSEGFFIYFFFFGLSMLLKGACSLVVQVCVSAVVTVNAPIIS